MKLAKGDMWTALEDSDLFCITTNAQTRKDGALVMGRGIALEATRRFPDFQAKAGQRLRDCHRVGKQYGLIEMELGGHLFGLFQVKCHWKDSADLELIRLSTEHLMWAIDHFRYKNVHLNFPGIGNGKLARADVLPIVEWLPDAVTVWELP